MNYSITRTLSKIDKLSIKLRVNINREGEYKNINVWDKGIALSFTPLLILTIDNKNVPYTRQQSIVLTPKTIYHFIKGLKNFIKLYSNIDEIFYLNDNQEVALNPTLSKDYYNEIKGLGDSNLVALYPNIVYDKDVHSHIGATICFNSAENKVNISYDDLLAFNDIMSKIDMIAYSQALVNYVEIMRGSKAENIEFRQSQQVSSFSGSVFNNI